MALRFFDSCGDSYATADLPGPWSSSVNAIIATGGYNSGKCLFESSTLGQWYVQAQNGAFNAGEPFVCGFRIKPTAYPASTPATIFGVNSELSTALRCILDMNTDGSLGILAGAATQDVVTAAAAIVLNDWNYIEIGFSSGFDGTDNAPVRLTITNSGGTHTTSGTLPSSGNVQTPTTTIRAGAAIGMVSALHMRMDDFYLLDGTTAFNNTFLGPQTVKVLTPNGEGRVDQFTPHGTSPNYACVNEIPPDGDTTYVGAASAGLTDCYSVSALSGLATVNGAMVVADARQTVVGGTRTLEVGVGNGATEDFSSGQQSLTTAYVMKLALYDYNPFTASAWATGDFSTLQAALHAST